MGMVIAPKTDLVSSSTSQTFASSAPSSVVDPSVDLWNVSDVFPAPSPFSSSPTFHSSFSTSSPSSTNSLGEKSFIFLINPPCDKLHFESRSRSIAHASLSSSL